MADVRPPWRFPLLALGFASLIIGIGAGLLRLGWTVPNYVASVAIFHGPLMVSGFFGTLISLERAVALKHLWAYLGPLAAGLGGLVVIFGASVTTAQILLALGSAILFIGSSWVFWRQRALFTFALAFGAACWLVGNLLWLFGFTIYEVVPWWAGFLVLTISAERLELSRFLRVSKRAVQVFGVIMAVLTLGMIFEIRVFGAALLVMTAWLFRQDIARRTVKEKGLTRFIAVCLLSGYVWLAVSGAFMLIAGLNPVTGTMSYDAAIHALTLGFVFSMVFGHAPVILPSVLRVTLVYHPVSYVPLLLLHLSLFVRLLGDAMANPGWRSMGGMLNAIALLAFVLNTIGAIVAGRRRKKS